MTFAEVGGMTRWFLAATLLLVSAGLASADYVIIVANIGAGKELNAQQGMGMAGMRGGMPGGMAGVPPGGGIAGAAGPQPGMMNPNMMPPGMGNRGGMAGMQGAMPGAMMGMRGGMAGGMMGMRGGMRGGMAGGMMGMAGMPGGMMGMMSMMNAGPTDVDDVPYFIVAIVEVEPTVANSSLYKKLTPSQLNPVPSAKVKHKWGASTLLHQTSFGQTIVLTKDSDHKPLPTVLHSFTTQFTKLFKDGKPTAEGILELADWTLAHGLVDKFPQVMDKLVEIDKSHPAAVAYLKIKAELDRPPARDEADAGWRKKLLGGYKIAESDRHHYVVVHNANGGSDVQMHTHLDLLENSFRGFYYWFALKGVVLPVPRHRLVAVVTAQQRDFNHFHKILTSGPVVVDGFFARRENLAVMANKRQDDTYDSLNKFWKKWEDRGFKRTEILSGKRGEGHPKLAAPDVVAEAQMVALMLKVLEQEAELATISHDASRQQLFASGLLPRNVAAPEWVLFGMGSFFETPLQSPWPGIGAPNSYYLPRWHELKGKGFERSPGDTLRKVISDAYFRAIPPEGESETPLRHAHDAAVRKARTSSWALTYYLAKSKLDGLQRYFKEVSKMPRDIELDDEVLLGCFARAFGCVDASNKVDKGKLDALARAWYSYMDNVKFESESTMKQIREIFREKLKQSQAQAHPAQPQIDPRTGQPLQPGAFPPNGGGQPPVGPVPPNAPRPNP
jgi:hypothetical protein